MTDHATPRDILATRIAQLQARIERIHVRQVDLENTLARVTEELMRVRLDHERRIDALERRASRDQEG